METEVVKAIEEVKTSEDGVSPSSLVSCISEFPVPLKEAMTAFIEDHPNWFSLHLMELQNKRKMPKIESCNISCVCSQFGSLECL